MSADTNTPALAGEVITTGLVETGPVGPPLYISQAPLGVRVRHRYHPVLNRWARESIPATARSWDSERKCHVITDEHWADSYLAKARELGFVVEQDEFTAATSKPKGYRSTWADTLARYVPFEHRQEVLGAVADVLEAHGDKGKTAHAAGQLRTFMEWGA
jgi:hypothetical protein